MSKCSLGTVMDSFGYGDLYMFLCFQTDYGKNIQKENIQRCTILTVPYVECLYFVRICIEYFVIVHFHFSLK